MIGKRAQSIHLAMVLAIGVTLIAAPAASADHTWVILAGEGCTFDVLLEATHLPEPVGERNPVGWGNATITNLDTGATYLHRTRYVARETFDPDTNSWLVEELGRKVLNFFPGDQGPNGLVEWPGLYLAFSGTRQYTVPADGFLFTSFSYTGTYVDLCPELSD